MYRPTPLPIHTPTASACGAKLTSMANVTLYAISMASHLPSRRIFAPVIQACQGGYQQFQKNQVPRLFSSQSAVKVTTHTSNDNIDSDNNNNYKFTRLESLRLQLNQEDSSLHEFASTEPIIRRKKAPPRSAKILPALERGGGDYLS